MFPYRAAGSSKVDGGEGSSAAYGREPEKGNPVLLAHTYLDQAAASRGRGSKLGKESTPTHLLAELQPQQCGRGGSCSCGAGDSVAHIKEYPNYHITWNHSAQRGKHRVVPRCDHAKQAGTHHAEMQLQAHVRLSTAHLQYLPPAAVTPLHRRSAGTVFGTPRNAQTILQVS
jgi:hypothetical protein